jgi:hypothetical protein
MKRFTLVLSFACCCFLGLVTVRMADATLLIISASKQKAILAAESRVTSATNKAYDDTLCKILVLNPLVFSGAGIFADTHGSLPKVAHFDGRVIAWESVREYRSKTQSPEANDSVNQIAKSWEREMLEKFQAAAPTRLADWLRIRQGNDSFLVGVFIGVEKNGELKVAVTTIEYSGKAPSGEIRSGTKMPELFNDFTWIKPFGIDAIANEHLAKNSRIHQEQYKNPELFDEKIPIELIDLSIKDKRWNKHPGPAAIGGPIHAVESGVRWINSKPNCR